MTAPDNAVQAARDHCGKRAQEIEAQTAKYGERWWPEGVAHAAALRTILAALTTAERDRDAAIKSASDGWRAAGEAQGRLEASETAGVVEGWRRRAEEAERLAEERLEALKSVLFVPGGRPGGAVYVQWEEDADMRQCAPCAAKIMHAALTAAAEGTGSGGALVSVVRETKGDA